MTDGGRIARRSARVFTDEYQPSREKAPRDGGHIPAACERDEQPMGEDKSRESSRSSLSPVNLETDVYSEAASQNSSRDGTPSPIPLVNLKEKIRGRPVNFGIVMPGFYRSGYPRLEDYEYLKSLELKTIITLVEKDYPEGYQLFMESNGIKHFVINVQGTNKVNIPVPVIQSILETALDRRNYPILMHCNQGKHRTGCVVAIIRKAIGWHLDAIIDEYTEYAYPKTRQNDIKYITRFEVESLSQMLQRPAPDITSPMPLFTIVSQARMAKMLFIALLILALLTFATVQLRQ